MMIRQFLNPPNWFTAASMFCGFYAITSLFTEDVTPELLYRAGLLVLFAGVFDMLDGRVARMTRTASSFGTQLDSLADVVSFGVTPALLAYAWGLKDLGVAGLAICFFFVVCGAFRLARFNVQADGKAHAESTGITITVAGGAVATIVMAHSHMGNDLVHPMNAALLIFVLSVLMVSKVPYRTFKTLRLSPLSVATLALLLGVGITLGVRYDISFVLVAMVSVYIVSGPFEAVYRLGRRIRGAQPDDAEPKPKRFRLRRRRNPKL